LEPIRFRSEDRAVALNPQMTWIGGGDRAEKPLDSFVRVATVSDELVEELLDQQLRVVRDRVTRLCVGGVDIGAKDCQNAGVDFLTHADLLRDEGLERTRGLRVVGPEPLGSELLTLNPAGDREVASKAAPTSGTLAIGDLRAIRRQNLLVVLLPTLLTASETVVLGNNPPTVHTTIAFHFYLLSRIASGGAPGREPGCWS